ncbi:multidrug transporter [Stenotrophomonas panacihumi]|uniref:Efflux pump membrane transporter n=1 Tax=Stenotrophomonas panacihumi TaxID=676599 RepID=A0A0R0AD64_9GAMM|nr:multidrug efflux RND transporter permease subunit [Stenotrophomonas panacihumi]KRG42859.1 multidrug transporter [Stenotrophomonas panacihumi]PTN55623.1 multidrug efflux RND transporter permease subunit [Stenotrophomonas panacihumi]
MSGFFVYRPVLAWVVALFALLFGGIALHSLPVEQYPDVAPPSLSIAATFVGADAQTVDRTVTSVIENELNGVDDFLFMTSTSRANGTAQIRVTFRSGTDLDRARSQVQDRLARVEPRLPEEVRQMGVHVTQSSTGFLMLIALQSQGGQRNALELGDFAARNIADELRRLPGVGDVSLFGSGYAMRIWLDREKLVSFGLSPAEVMAAIREQNAQTAGGGLGLQPVAPGTETTAQIVTRGRFSSAAQFRQIIVRATPDGATVRLGDIARVELGNDTYAFNLTLNGEEAAGLAVSLSSGANALATARLVRERLESLQATFPPDVRWSTPFDTTPFITESVSGVVRTMIEAMVMVSIVVLLFLQSWRAMLLPTLVVPISLVGTCLGLLAFGMSINLLSLFAMVVAIGILNDDAIVIVENVERIMREDGLEARPATAKAMGQLSGAIIATSMVLWAVFVPMGFFPGSAGGIYRQFAVTLSVSLGVSTILSLTLAPAICGATLRPHDPAAPGPGRRLFGAINRALEKSSRFYADGVGKLLKRPWLWVGVFVAAVLLTGLLYARLPGGFLPEEDQGYLFVAYNGAPGATVARTREAVRQAEAILRQQPEVRNVATVVGFSFFGQGQNVGMSFVDLKPWAERGGAAHGATALARRMNGAMLGIPQAQVFVLNPPAIQALGNASGFTMKIEDRGGAGERALQATAMALAQRAAASDQVAGVRPEGMPRAPQLFVDIDRTQARALGVPLGQVNQALGVMFGSAYVNDFVHQGNVARVFVQGEAAQRMRAEDVADLRVIGSSGQSVPFSAFARTHWTVGEQQVERYNGFLSATVSGQAAPGVSSGAALREMERLAAEVLPPGMRFEWTGTAREEQEAAGQVGLLLGLALLVAFLLLAALYESWTTPVAVLLAVPFGILGAVVFTGARGMSADVYFNVGLVTIIGLAAKNAILIVQFGLDEEARGVPTDQAILAAAHQRLRPILMTSLTFIVGMLPLVFAVGAGAASRQAVGTGVLGSMFTATLFGIFYTPLFYYLLRRRAGARTPPPQAAP